MHVDEDLAELAVVVLAGVQIDLVAADAGLLDIALAAVGQLAAGAVAFDDPLDDAFLGLGRRRGRGRAHRQVGDGGDVEDQRRGRRVAANPHGDLGGGEGGLHGVGAGGPGHDELEDRRDIQDRGKRRQHRGLGPRADLGGAAKGAALRLGETCGVRQVIDAQHMAPARRRSPRR